MLRNRSALAAVVAAALSLGALPARAQAPAPLLPPAPPSGLPKLRVKDAIELALRNHPATRAAFENTEAARWRTEQAKSAYLPRVLFGAQWLGGTINGNPASFINFPDMPRIAGSKPNRQASDYALWGNYLTGISTGIPIYDFGRTEGRVDEAASLARSQEAQERQVREQIIFAVQRAYFETLVAEGGVRSAEQSVQRLSRYAAQAEAMVRQGVRRPIEVPRSQAELARAQVRLVAAKNVLKVARVTLDNAIGLSTEGRFVLDAAAGGDDVKGTLKEYLAAAIKERPELEQFRHQARSLEGRLESVRGNYYPTLSATAAVNLRGTGGVGNWLNYDAGVLLIWPLFEGNLFRRQEYEVRARLRGLSAQLDDQKQRIELEVRAAYATVESAREFIRAARAAFQHAAQNLRLAQESYTRGLTTIVELSDDEELYLVAQLNAIRAGFDLQVAMAQLRRAVGQPLTVVAK